MMKTDFFSDKEKNTSIKKVIEKYLIGYGDIDYTYGVMDKKNPDNMIFISNRPDFCREYLDKGYQNIDPVVVKSLSHISSFKWDENIRVAFQYTPSRVFELSRNYNILCGYSFVLHDPYDHLAILSIAIDKLFRPEAEALIETTQERLHWILIQTHEMLLHIYKASQNDEIIKELTSREMEILYWSSIGKTYVEISQILGIAVSTVKFHMRNIVNKMGVKNAKHAIRLCAELDIISPSI